MLFFSAVMQDLIKPPPTRTIVLSNDSSSSSRHLVGKGRQSGNERSGEKIFSPDIPGDTRKKDSGSWGLRVAATGRKIV